MRSKAVIVLAGLGAALVTGGWLVGEGLGAPRAAEASIAGGPRLFQQVAAHVKRDFVDEVSDSVLYASALRGMVRELGDPNSTILPAERLKRLAETTSGNYAGVGLRAVARDGWIVVVDALPATPAERAGIRPGDRLVEVAGESTRNFTQEEASRRLRGEPNTRVRVLVERPGVEGRIPFTLTREAVHVKATRNVELLRDGVGYLFLANFSGNSADEVREGVDSLRALGARSVVLDLRGNPGGLLDQGVSVADLFLDPGQPIVRIEGRTPETRHVLRRRGAAALAAASGGAPRQRRQRERRGDRRRRAAGPRPRPRARPADVRQGERAERRPAARRLGAQAHHGALVHAGGSLDQPPARLGR
jgi:carboxyl-terminal processing protease